MADLYKPWQAYRTWRRIGYSKDTARLLVTAEFETKPSRLLSLFIRVRDTTNQLDEVLSRRRVHAFHRRNSYPQ